MFKVSHVDFPNQCVFLSLNIAFIKANSADPDDMQQTNKLPFQGLSTIQRVYSALSDKFNRITRLGLIPLGLRPLYYVCSIILFFLFVWYDSLRLINNISVKQDGSSWVEPVLS